MATKPVPASKDGRAIEGSAASTKRPPSGEPLRGADILVEALVREGVDLIFGYPGGASMEIHQAVTRSDIRCVLCRHEQGEVFAAEGYAKASGKVGVCLATSGPGATNLVTGLADAKMDSVPIVAITGQVPTHLIGGDAFQETATVEITRQITKHNFLVDRVDDLPRIVKEAFYIASTGRPGPVLIDVPKDIQQAYTVPIYPETVAIRSYNPHIKASRAQIQAVAEAIKAAKRPVVYAGGGIICADASAELRAFIGKTRIPVVQTLMGLGAYPETDPLSLQMVGMHGTVYANYAINHADLLLAMGVRFDDRVTGKLEEFCKHGKIVHIDVDPSEINKNKVAHFPVHSDVKYALEDLNGIVEPGDYGDWWEEIEAWRKRYPMAYKEMGGAILPQHAISVLYELTEGRAVISTGVGQHQMWAAQYYLFDEPRNWLTSGGLGAMGFGLPAAIGAALARPDAMVVDVDGDGSFVMNVQELATLYTEKIPVKTMILNNQHLGMVVQWEDILYESNRAHTFIGDPEKGEIHPNFVQIAEGFKIPGERVVYEKDLRPALERMIQSPGPYLLDVIVPHQEHVLPMIPSGKSFSDIIIE